MAKSVVCPYCYEIFAPREIMFRCNGRLSRTGNRCPLAQDSVQVARFGQAKELPPAFRGDGRKQTADCPHCGSETTYRICPVCHSLLPVHFGQVDSRLIAMAGARESGKTVYMTVLLHEIRNRVGARFGASIMGADDETRKRFETDYEDLLYQGRHLFPSTQTAAARDGRVEPLVFRFAASRGGLMAGPEHTLLSFFDTAGEDFATQESVDVNTRYLVNSDGIVLILDPLQMAGARIMSASGIPLPGTGAQYETPVNILSRVTDILLTRAKGGAKARINKPIAVVFSKLDALWHNLDRASPLRAHPPGGPRFDVSDCLDVHEEVRHLLQEWEGSQIDQILHNHYRRYRYFGISALGQPPTLANDVAPSGIQPYRVADPFLWLLSEFGAVPKQGKG